MSAAHLHPVTDIIVLQDDDPLPEGFVRLTHSVSGTYPADLSAGSRAGWLAVARFPHPAVAITGLALINIDAGEFIPTGFMPVRRAATGRAADIYL